MNSIVIASIFLIAHLILSTTAINSTTNMCLEADKDFQDLCTTTYQGVAVGGQCFFVASDTAKASWDEAWASCRSAGAVMAQLQSQQESDAVTAYLNSKVPTNGQYPWATLSLRDDVALSPPKDVMEETTLWFTGETSSSLRIKSGDTWIRSRSNEGGAGFPGPARCIMLFNKFAQVGDQLCTNNPHYVAFCQISNLSQKYTKTKDKCITENPIKTTTVQSPDDCGTQCSKETWCRSFNLKTNQGSSSITCQLFTWSLFDTTCKGGNACAKTAATDGCTSYSVRLSDNICTGSDPSGMIPNLRVGFWPNQYSSAPSPTATECKQSCQASSTCKISTYVSGYCYLSTDGLYNFPKDGLIACTFFKDSSQIPAGYTPL